MLPPARTITVALDMSKAFDTINIHTLIRKLLQTNIPGTIIKFITKGRNAYTTYRNHTSRRQFKTGVLSPTLFNIDTSDLPPPSAPVQVMAYADDFTITSTQARVQPRNIYNHTYIKFLPGQNKTTYTLFTPDPAEYTSNLDLKIHNTALPMTTHPMVLGLTLCPKLTYSTHIHISVHVHKPLYMLSVYSPFCDRVVLPLHNILSPFISVIDMFFVDLKFCHIRFYTL